MKHTSLLHPIFKKTLFFALPLLFFTAHIIEEYFWGFPHWSTKYFGTTTPTSYIVTHILFFAAISLITICSILERKGHFWRILQTALIVQFVVNALFHILTALWYKSYSPGVITSLAAVMPLGISMLKHVSAEAILSEDDFPKALIIGTIIGIIIVESLWLG